MSIVRVLRIDDVVPGFPWEKFRPLENALLESGVRPIVGVVPACEDPKIEFEPGRSDFWDVVRAWRDRGWTISQHGYRHRYDTEARSFLGVSGKSEFAGHSYEEQMSRLSAGKAILEAEGVWQPYFMAPGHNFDANTLRALRAVGFTAVTDGWGAVPYLREGITLVPQLFASPRHLGVGVATQCLHIGPMSETSILRVATFVREHAHEFTDFPSAAHQKPGSAWLAPLLRGVTATALPLARKARRVLS